MPADGFVEYEYFEIPTNFTEDKWLEGLEVRPGNRAVVHHVIVFDAPAEAGTPSDGVPRRAAGWAFRAGQIGRRGGTERQPTSAPAGQSLFPRSAARRPADRRIRARQQAT